ncbi:winged helix-turn-helix domain-containing protein [Paenibacillus athensensis]|uniref:Bacterial transcriptional activator domain-containing protein n=1 Tax=Paenibacillus athensensis TaxID=1967502 RepID=A0A4Y8PUG6_9BACL|nr:BTAD domain-containing putative transcriptional regulator [Paenibacillus athensensis]MCD1261708.1 winged helix-turn-helix domain-containing protein [Paenibacillus athensensis]
MIVTTKIGVPQLHRGDLVARPWLIGKLDEGLAVKLTLVAAPAGYGKTTALGEWAAQCACPVAWISLDKYDDSWLEFWSYVTAAIAERIPGFGASVLPLLEQGPTSSAFMQEPALTALINELNQVSGEVVIVLDDYHFIEQAAIHRSLAYLLERLPRTVHLYVSSRTEVTLPTSRLLVKGELLRISSTDLRFRQEEILAFFDAVTSLSLSRDDRLTLGRQTEGWVSGLQLAAISLAHSGNAAESIRQFNGHQHHIADYLLEEVYRDLAEPLREFLLRTSILGRMNADLCRSVAEQANAQEQLEQLEALNLFIVPLDEERQWYRYHHLLAEFLQQRFARTRPDEWAEAHVRAAVWMESRGAVEQAAEHYLAAGRYEAIVQLIEPHLPELIHRKSAVVGRWVMQVPESVLTRHPLVEMFYLLLLVGIGQAEAAASKIEQARLRYTAMKISLPEAEWKALMGNMYFLCATASYFRKDLARVSEYFDLAEQYAPEGGFLQAIGDNRYHASEEFDDHLSFINDHHAVAEVLPKWLQLWAHKKRHPFMGRLYASYSKLLHEWDRLDEAEACLMPLLEADAPTPNTRSLLQIYLSASRIQQALGRPERAVEQLEQLKLMLDSPDYGLFMRKVEAERAVLAVRQGDFAHGAAWLERCGMTAADEVSLPDVSEHIAVARVLAACGRAEEALELAERLQQLLWKADRLRDRIRMLLLQGVTLWRTGRAEKALSRLDSALRLAKPQGFIRSFADEGPAMVELLAAYLPALRSGAFADANGDLAKYASLLLATCRREPLQVKAQARLQVRCMGRFHVQGSQDERQEVKWRTSKTEELLAYLLHHRGEPVDKHVIMDRLWSDVDADKAAMLLNTTVYYLRKNLAAIGLDNVVLYARSRYRVDMTAIDCDLDAVHKQLASGLPASSDLFPLYEEELTRMYRSGYLSGSDYPWAEEERSRLEQRYVDQLLRMQERYMREKRTSEAAGLLRKALIYDPLNEDIHTRLIEAYAAAGDRVAAQRQYEALKRMLKTEFGVEPSEEVQRLMRLNRQGN